MQHLATAVNSKGDFRQFTQSIDRVHTELTSLLAIFSPFDPATFPETYRKFLEPNFPPSVKPAVVGLARSAMNVFGGVNAAVLKNNPNPVRVCGAHSYYEEAAVVGGTRTLDQALNDPAVEKVDLYVAEFNHNIDIDPNHTNYQKGSVIQDIRNIFEKKPNTDQLTVAIDATIDFTNSDDMKELFSAFAKEIQEGKLNIVVFRSGQKFDMLGLDNYFGSPFYAVNNGDKKWADFNNIATEEVFHTDALSQQYFSWMAETGPQLAEEYKGHIFNNARAILDVVPPGLKPGVHDGVCVCTFENDVKTPFIDIKLKLPEPQNYEMRKWISNRFKELFINEGKFLYERGSFGFAHPNITWIDPKFRINPGIDADDIRIFAQFLQEFEAKVNELTTSA